MRQIFVDLDNTLSDLVTHYKNVFGVQLDIGMYRDHGKDNIDWKAVRGHGNFFLDMPPMPDMDELWNYVKHENPIVLTGIPDPEKKIHEAEENKRAWVRKHLGDHVEVRCCQAKHKYMHCSKGDILIDDWTKYKHLWEAAGGIFVTHINAITTIKQLQQIQMLNMDKSRFKKRY